MGTLVPHRRCDDFYPQTPTNPAVTNPAYVHFRDQLLEGGHTLDWQNHIQRWSQSVVDMHAYRKKTCKDPPVQELLAATFAAKARATEVVAETRPTR